MRALLLYTLAAVGLAAGCSRGPAPMDDPVAAWAQDPEATTAALQAEPDPARRALAVTLIVAEHPGAAGALCGLLEEGTLRGHCQRTQERPHLWTIQLKDGAPPPDRLWEPPGKAPPFPSVFAPLPGDGALAPGCAGEPSCLLTEALRRAGEADTRAAEALCGAIGPTRLRQDCFFAAAEASPGRPGEYAEDLRLCVGAGTYAEQCHVHLLLDLQRHLADETPPALAALSKRIAEVWVEAGQADTVPWVLNLYWSTVIGERGFLLPDALETLPTLPPEAAPHMRSLRAQREVNAPFPHEGGLWNDVWPGEEAIRVVLMPYDAARPGADAPELDMALALLEARVRAGDLDAARAQLGAEEPLLRWSAARLLRGQAPQDPALLPLRDDPDPLVAARAQALPPPPPATP
ncbi:MAG: hypothetical protein H6741_13915 [Alphaproteobacteria bacterium]|nr:hypothetical protein [Alphaproteobacteria bacterium]